MGVDRATLLDAWGALLNWAERPCQTVCGCAGTVCADDKQRMDTLLIGRFNPYGRWLMRCQGTSVVPDVAW
jgi:hypothetical protein